jgi:hypothetical protein
MSLTGRTLMEKDSEVTPLLLLSLALALPPSP